MAIHTRLLLSAAQCAVYYSASYFHCLDDYFIHILVHNFQTVPFHLDTENAMRCADLTAEMTSASNGASLCYGIAYCGSGVPILRVRYSNSCCVIIAGI